MRLSTVTNKPIESFPLIEGDLVLQRKGDIVADEGDTQVGEGVVEQGFWQVRPEISALYGIMVAAAEGKKILFPVTDEEQGGIEEEGRGRRCEGNTRGAHPYRTSLCLDKGVGEQGEGAKCQTTENKEESFHASALRVLSLVAFALTKVHLGDTHYPTFIPQQQGLTNSIAKNLGGLHYQLHAPPFPVTISL